MKSFEVCFSHRNPPDWHAHGQTKGKSAIHKIACRTYDAPWVGVWDSAWQTCNSCDADIVNASVATSLEDCCAIRFRHSDSARTTCPARLFASQGLAQQTAVQSTQRVQKQLGLQSDERSEDGKCALQHSAVAFACYGQFRAWARTLSKFWRRDPAVAGSFVAHVAFHVNKGARVSSLLEGETCKWFLDNWITPFTGPQVLSVSLAPPMPFFRECAMCHSSGQMLEMRVAQIDRWPRQKLYSLNKVCGKCETHR